MRPAHLLLGFKDRSIHDQHLGNQIHYGKKQERFMGGTMTGIGRPAVYAAVGVEL